MTGAAPLRDAAADAAAARPRPITPATRTFALLGDPVSHSLSPSIQNAAIAAAGVDGVYVALRCAAARVPTLMRALAEAGGGGNITVPHKAVAAEALDAASEAVTATGACNTFWSEHGRLCGDNTDVDGFVRAVAALGVELARIDALVLGAGGAAAAAVHALLTGGARRIALRNRTVARARRLADRLDPERRVIDCVAGVGPGERFHLVVNATTLGLHSGDASPLDWDVGPSADAALDLVYSPSGTAWVRDARARGIRAADGKTMLLAQAAAAFERWWSRSAPVAAMHAALRAG